MACGGLGPPDGTTSERSDPERRWDADSCLDLYVDAHARGSRATLRDPERWIEAEGIVGRLGSPSQPDGRLLVTGDSAMATLRGLGDPWAQVVTVVEGAPGPIEHLRGLGRYQEGRATAMVAPDLAALPELAPPAALRVVDVPADERRGPVSLEDAAAACQRADATAADVALEGFVAFLRSIPSAGFLAAVDAGGVVRATAASSSVDGVARVFFVSTDPSLRGQGVGTAMTASALRSAARRGATSACLDASEAGRSIYLRLGFLAVAEVVMFMRLA